LDLFQGSKIQLSSLESVRTFRVKLEAYRATLDTYHIGEAEFAPNGQLYREIKDRKFTQPDLQILCVFTTDVAAKDCGIVQKEF
jgi:hypothetical protein